MKPLQLIVAALLGGVFTSSLQAIDVATADQEAKFLAGLPVDGVLEPLTHESSWKEHEHEFSKAWAEVDKKQLSKIAAWMPQVSSHSYEDTSPLYYMFSGPDFLYAHAFFPNAATTIMCGIEPVGPPPNVEALTPEHRATALRTLRKSLEAVLAFSFFKTKDMKNDLQGTELSGTLPVLYLFIAHAGCHIDRAESVWLDDKGEEVHEKARVPGAKITFHGASNTPQTVYYFSSDLSDDGIKKNPAFLTFCDKHGMGNSFAKAASYLMHMSAFSTVRDFLLSHSKNIIQDDSGIPYHFFKPTEWDVRLAGHYKGPIDLFKEDYQNDLAAAYKVQPPMELPFSAGYRWHANESCLMLSTALKAVPKAEPVK
ncbi:MAG: hypothetical protein JWO94_3320 [Verrucomicrobiaceae bacterium]|nr:hypothetical protein [Verrucomicrobiaceae bacterium]